MQKEPIFLTDSELQQVLTRVSPPGIEHAAARICRLLANQPKTTSHQVKQVCSVGNISDQVSKRINPRIVDLGLFVACHKPPQLVLNKLSQRTGHHMLWSFYRAANDADGGSQ
jgi:hypothetical protein